MAAPKAYEHAIRQCLFYKMECGKTDPKPTHHRRDFSDGHLRIGANSELEREDIPVVLTIQVDSIRKNGEG